MFLFFLHDVFTLRSGCAKGKSSLHSRPRQRVEDAEAVHYPRTFPTLQILLQPPRFHHGIYRRSKAVLFIILFFTFSAYLWL